MATKRISAENIDPTMKALLVAMLADIQNAGVSAAVATDFANVFTSLTAVKADLDALRATVLAGFATLSAHVHAGVTVGAGSTSAIAAVAAPAAITNAAPSAVTAVAIASAQVIA